MLWGERVVVRKWMLRLDDCGANLEGKKTTRCTANVVRIWEEKKSPPGAPQMRYTGGLYSRGEQIEEHRQKDALQIEEHSTYKTRMQLSPKDLSLAIFEITIDHRAYRGGGSSYEVGPKPISFHVIMQAVDNPA